MIERLTVSLAPGYGGQGAGQGDGPQERVIGQLGRDPARRGFALEWDAEFAAAPLPIWPVHTRQYSGLLRGPETRPGALPGLFEDSLPDGWGRLLLDREINAAGASRAQLDDLHRLAFVGTQGMGALSYRPVTAPQSAAELDLSWFEGVIGRIDDETDLEVLQRLRVISGGSQGARPKFVAQIGPDQRSLRDHRAPWQEGWTHVLIKGRGSLDPKGAIEAELAYGALMRRAGIDCQQMFSLKGSLETFFATHRFDRDQGRRRHMASVAGLLNTGLQHGVFDYVDLMRLAKTLCLNKAQTAEELFRRMVFNVRAISRDDHIRNHALLMDTAGQWHLAPAFDVTFDPGPGGEHSMAVAGEGRAPGQGAFATVAEIGGIKAKRRDQIIAEVDAALADWPQVAQEHGVPKPLRQTIEREIAAARRWA
ncbi:type II toxin-antitoxin system HipA family toxin [Cognatishimia sp. SS12]|uniref:type II toxin-antitoxin system HipA family toxin n=1 Tax=Cognatishimia sp. SS12 TaxID=2979465 RepID=UPI00232EB40A|nr:type II toxin-antitoxin system HipA family toxin [Cognatishimia sp. SS12]MDC0739354.1 type II toxin-antitoxin system HipA family toxin [Cognatishimia sp. SS12]